MNELLEALSGLLGFIVEDARAHRLDVNHIEDERFRHLRADMARLAADLSYYLDQTNAA